MQKLISSIFAILLFVQSSFAQVGDDDLSKIYQLMNDKKYPEALVAHQAFFKDSKGTSLAAVRLSFGLASWAELGKVYPPAHSALEKLAAERKDAIYSGASDFDVFHEYTSINSYLNQSDESIETFLYVEKHFPKQTITFYPLVADVLIAKKRYDIVKKYADDAIYQFESLRYYRENSLSQLRKGQAGYSLQQINAEFDQKYKVLLETTEKIGQQDEATELKRRYDTYMNGNLLRKYH